MSHPGFTVTILFPSSSSNGVASWLPVWAKLFLEYPVQRLLWTSAVSLPVTEDQKSYQTGCVTSLLHLRNFALGTSAPINWMLDILERCWYSTSSTLILIRGIRHLNISRDWPCWSGQEVLLNNCFHWVKAVSAIFLIYRFSSPFQRNSFVPNILFRSNLFQYLVA